MKKFSAPLLQSSKHTHLAIVLFIAITSGLLCSTVQFHTTGQAGDFTWALQAAKELIAGRDVYLHPFGNDLVPYPLPTAFFALPFVLFAAPIAAGVFFGLSSMVLAWCLLRSRQYWGLMVFLSWPYFYSLIFTQWTPLIVCIAFLSPFLPFLLVKPQNAIPLLLFHPFSRSGIVLLVLVGLTSLAIYPNWPLVWLSQINGYKGMPPLLSLPFGPLLLFALFRYRNRQTWFFLLLAVMPQRVIYDQLAIFLIACTRKELLVLIACSWITLPALFYFGGWTQFPGGWQSWIVLTLYMPALLVILLRKKSPTTLLEIL